MNAFSPDGPPEGADDLKVKLDDDDILAELGLIDDSPPGGAGAKSGVTGKATLDADGIPDVERSFHPPPSAAEAPAAPLPKASRPEQGPAGSPANLNVLRRIRGLPLKMPALYAAATLLAVAAGWLIAATIVSPGPARPDKEMHAAPDGGAALDPVAAATVIDITLAPFYIPVDGAGSDPVFLRITIILQADTGDDRPIQENIDIVRRAAYMVMTRHDAGDYFNTTSVEQIRREIMHAVNQTLHATVVYDVNFVDIQSV
jgi:flagellar basal body-associated protein FliL